MIDAERMYELLVERWEPMISAETHVEAASWGDAGSDSYGAVIVARGDAARKLMALVGDDDVIPPFKVARS